MLKVPDESVSIIVPTLREAKNIPVLVAEIAKIDFKNRLFEVIIVDDNSQDGTEEWVAEHALIYPWVRLILRYQNKGLSFAVMDGFKAAKYANLVVLDADLSHPVNKIPDMLELLNLQNVDFVIGSRYVKGGSSDMSWSWFRKILSTSAAKITSFFVGVSIQDPLSGFIALRKRTFLKAEDLNPIGWKIGLELIVKCRCQHVREIPIHFAKRAHGASKLSVKVLADYLLHLCLLAKFRLKLKRKVNGQPI